MNGPEIHQQAIAAAAKMYLDRKYFRAHPSGWQDDKGAWHLTDEEIRACCKQVSSGYLFNTHARSLEHIANLFDVTVDEVLKEIVSPKAYMPE